MTRYTQDHDPQPEPHEIEAFTQPDIHLPDDWKWELVLWGSMALSAVGLAYCIVKLVPILGGIFSW